MVKVSMLMGWDGASRFAAFDGVFCVFHNGKERKGVLRCIALHVWSKTERKGVIIERTGRATIWLGCFCFFVFCLLFDNDGHDDDE